MWVFLVGFLSGILAVAVVAYVVLFNGFGKVVPLPSFIDQFQPLKIPQELKNFLRSRPEGGSEWESCFSISLLLHFLFQEHKDTRRFRRWVYKKLQLELNDVTTRSAAGRIILGIQIRDLSVGTQFPLVKNIRVEQFLMSEDRELFEELAFVVDLDYRGGFETSVDVSMIFGRFAHLSVKVLRLSGKARITLTRRPFAHWTFAFIEMPELDFKIDSQFQGRQLKHMIPLITQAFRKTLQRKHVWPNYKIRYRPLLPNPFLQPSPPISSFEHVKINGMGLEVTVLQCTRLNTQLVELDDQSVPFEVYCSVSLDQRPFVNNAKTNSTHCVSVMLTFTRKGAEDPIGLSFSKSAAETAKAVKVQIVDPSSTAEKCGFKEGDVLLAINNVPIRNERQATRILGGTSGDLLVLVERDLNFYMEDDPDEYEEEEVLVENGQEEFICVGAVKKKGRKLNESLNEVNLNKEKGKRQERSSSICSTESRKNKQESDATPTRKRSTMEEGFIGCAYVPVLSASLPERNLISENFLDQPTAQSSPKKTNNKSPSNESEFSLSNPTSPVTASTPGFRLEKDLVEEEKIDAFDFNIAGEMDKDNQVEDQLVRTKSVHIPKLSVQSSSIDLRKSRSESELQLFSDLDSSSINTALLNVAEEGNEEEELEEDLEEEEVDEEFENALIDGDDPSHTFRATLNSVLEQSGKKESSGPYSPKIAASSRRERFQARASEMASKLHAGRSKVNDFLWSKRNQKDVSPTYSLRSGTAVYGDAVGEFEEADPERNTDSIRRAASPLAGVDDPNKPMPAEVAVQDKLASKRRWIRRKGKSPTPSTSSQLAFVESSIAAAKRSNLANDSFPNSEHDHSPSLLVTSRGTKAVPLAKNVLWGQSLHFGLEKKLTMYLNVTVHARRKGVVNSEGENKKSILLGHTSVYIPQVIDDCQLTLANCHREVFQLRPPSNENNEPPVDFSELARHTGFDNRLCFGDITLGFRFFPQGLPSSSIRAGANSPDSPNKPANQILAQETTDPELETVYDHPLQQGRNSPMPNPNAENILNRSLSSTVYSHKWMAVNLKHGLSYPCGMCKGKIWLKWASRCTICNFVCHNKCVEKTNREHECVPDTRTMNFEDDAHFEVLDGVELISDQSAFQPEIEESYLNTGDADSISTSNTTSRRRRIANKVSEKLTTTWRNVGVPKMRKIYKQTSPTDSVVVSTTISTDLESAMTENSNQGTEIDGNQLVSIVETLAKDFPDLRLEGSPMLRELKFEPGNAYNSRVISDTKVAGQKVFEHIGDNSLRKARINEQIDAIQSRIDYLANLRRTIVDKSGDEYDSIDARREALALLMLHYCSGLSECMDKEELQHKNKLEQKSLEEKTVEKEGAEVDAILSEKVECA